MYATPSLIADATLEVQSFGGISGPAEFLCGAAIGVRGCGFIAPVGFDAGGMISPPLLVRIPRAAATHTAYRLVLTGSADGKPDVVLPMTSFQSRLRQNDPTYLGAVVPNAVLHGQAVTDRPNADMVVESGLVFPDGRATLWEEIARAGLDDIRIDSGPESSSICLEGRKNITHQGRQLIILKDVQTLSCSGGKHRVRASIDRFLRPGDLVQAGEITFTAGVIVHTVDVTSQYMDVTEAD